MSIHDISEVVNNGMGMSFKDFINDYRVEAVKNMLLDPKSGHLSLMGIALDCGFNSKATFNRVFKSKTGETPQNLGINRNPETSHSMF